VGRLLRRSATKQENEEIGKMAKLAHLEGLKRKGNLKRSEPEEGEEGRRERDRGLTAGPDYFENRKKAEREEKRGLGGRQNERRGPELG